MLTACGGSQSELDRLATPLRFGELRETASWTPDFDPQWWKPIDAAYAEYDRSIDDALLARWDEFASDVAEERIRGQTPDLRRARKLVATHREIDRALAGREAAFLSALSHALPSEADGYVELVAARMAFHRASSMLREPGQRLPGPLEVMQLVGRSALSAAQVAEATAEYRRLATTAESIIRTRIQKYVELCGDLESIEAARNDVDDNARKTSDAARESRVKQWDGDAARGLEQLRLALLREGRQFALAIADAQRQSDFLEELDASLHDGMRSAPGMRAFCRIARIAIARAHPDDAAVLADFDRTVEQELDRQRALRATLSSGSRDSRQAAYEALQHVGDPIGAIVDKQLKDRGGVWRVLERTADVRAGVQSAESAADAALAPQEPPPQEPEQFIVPGRDRNLQILLGCALEPQAFRALSERLQLTADAEREMKALYDRESTELEAVGREVSHAVGDDFQSLGKQTGAASPAAMINGFMARLAGHIGRMNSADRGANERLLAEAARLAGTDADDARIEITRLELQLLSDIGASRNAHDAEPLVGVLDAAIANPFELVRAVASSESERAAAEAVVMSHADELRAAHRAMQTAMRRNLRDFLIFAVESSGLRRAVARWRPELAGTAAAELRIQIARDLRVALGDAFADRYDARFRDTVAKGCEPRRTAAFAALDRYAAGAGVPEADRLASADIRAVIAELLDGADDRRNAALRQFVEWRAHWVRIGDFGSPESWNELERVSPKGWILRARAADADERALAACEALLDFDGAPAQELRALRMFPVVAPRRMRPNFD